MLGFTPDQFTVLFGIPRTVGWLAQWQKIHEDPGKGEPCRDFVPIELRAKETSPPLG